MPKQSAIKVAILWHMHQPNYREPNSDRLAMPWVRLHALKDYLDMPLLAGAYDKVKTTFNLVPSLIDQIELYLAGGTDRHLELSRIPADKLDEGQKLEILTSFFAGHRPTMVDPYPVFKQLHRKYSQSAGQRGILASLFSTTELRDLQVWSNLTWVDPMFRSEEPVKSLLAKTQHYTEEDKLALLDWQMDLLKRIIPTYRDMLESGRIDISFTPYYHPILPLLCDTDSAKEALPGITLPKKRFIHPEDARHQVVTAMEKFESLFGRKLTGMWPSEGSVSEEVLDMMCDLGIKWAATDEEILYHSLAKSGMNPGENTQHAVYEYGQGIKMIFRDHKLSDRLGFVYSGWSADDAVADLTSKILSLRDLFRNRLDSVVVPVILDGENAWEYFPEDGREFLESMYSTFNDHPHIQTVTMTEAAESLPSTELPSVFAGSWIAHNFRIWIGHEEDNAAWNLLTRARDTLTKFEKENPGYDTDKLAVAWEQIYIAEGSDWCWWYGDEHRGAYNEQFDSLFRRHLTAVYESIGIKPPLELYQPIHGEGVSSFTIQPSDILTARIEGRVTHFYEWAGAGYYDCLKVGGAMHRGESVIAGIHFAFDHNRFYIRLDFHNKKNVVSLKNQKIRFGFYTPNPKVVELELGDTGYAGETPGEYQYAVDDILELAVERTHLWADGYGQIGFNVTIMDGDNTLESWPAGEPIGLEVPEKNKEIFWPS